MDALDRNCIKDIDNNKMHAFSSLISTSILPPLRIILNKLEMNNRVHIVNE